MEMVTVGNAIGDLVKVSQSVCDDTSGHNLGTEVPASEHLPQSSTSQPQAPPRHTLTTYEPTTERTKVILANVATVTPQQEPIIPFHDSSIESLKDQITARNSFAYPTFQGRKERLNVFTDPITFDDQRANPALLEKSSPCGRSFVCDLSRERIGSVGGTPGGKSSKSALDDGYGSSNSTPLSTGRHKTSKHGSIVTLTCYKKEPKVLIEEEAKQIDNHLISKEDEEDLAPDDGRETWGSGADFLLSIIGFAVDLANVWRFPYLCYRNGGGMGRCEGLTPRLADNALEVTSLPLVQLNPLSAELFSRMFSWICLIFSCAFLIPYTLMLIFGALPLFYMELLLGQYHRQGPISLWKICPLFKGVGFCAVMVAFYVSFYYNVIIGWSLYFLASSATSELPWLHCNNTWNSENCWVGSYGSYGSYGSSGSDGSNGSNDSVNNISTARGPHAAFTGPLSRYTPASEFFHRGVLEMQKSAGIHDLGVPKWQLAVCLGIVYVALYLSLFKGVKSSGKVVWATATLPYVVLTLLLARGLALPGAARGIAYYLQPELSRLKDTQVWVDAAVQIFYSVGAGFGVHLSYASYNTFHNNCYKDCLVTTAVNCFTSFFSGFVIFTYLGFMSHKQGVPISAVATEGPGLVFQVYPEAVATLPGANVWAMLFFFMLIMLGLDSGMGGLECVITGLLDELRGVMCASRARAREYFTLIVVCISFCVACVNITPGGIYMFHLFDTYSAGISLLCSALFEAVAVSWFYGLERFSSDAEEMLGFRPGLYWRICWKFISPTFIIGVVVFGLLYQQPLEYQEYMYPRWAERLGWTLTLSSVLAIPVLAVVQLSRMPGTPRQRLACWISPTDEHQDILNGKPVSRFTWRHWLYV